MVCVSHRPFVFYIFWIGSLLFCHGNTESTEQVRLVYYLNPRSVSSQTFQLAFIKYSIGRNYLLSVL
jgi:hypothetical protein